MSTLVHAIANYVIHR